MRERTKNICVGICFIVCLTVVLNMLADSSLHRSGTSQESVRNFKSGLAEAERLSNQNLTLLVTIVTAPYRTMTDNWLCNTKHMNIHKQIIIICTDHATAEKLKHDWPEINTVHVSLPDDFSVELKFSQPSYLKLMAWRTKLIYAFLKRRIELLLFEVDTVWIKNPLKEIEKFPDNELIVKSGGPLEYQVCGCFIYFRPTKRTLALWDVLNTKMQNFYKSVQARTDTAETRRENNDQIYLTQLLRNPKEKYAVNFRKLPLRQMPEGLWYDLPDNEKYNDAIYVIHNNFNIGTRAKLERFQESGQWFLQEDSTCNEVKVMEYLQRFKDPK